MHKELLPVLYALVRSQMDFEKVQFFDGEQLSWVHAGGLGGLLHWGQRGHILTACGQISFQTHVRSRELFEIQHSML